MTVSLSFCDGWAHRRPPGGAQRTARICWSPNAGYKRKNPLGQVPEGVANRSVQRAICVNPPALRRTNPTTLSAATTRRTGLRGRKSENARRRASYASARKTQVARRPGKKRELRWSVRVATRARQLTSSCSVFSGVARMRWTPGLKEPCTAALAGRWRQQTSRCELAPAHSKRPNSRDCGKFWPLRAGSESRVAGS